MNKLFEDFIKYIRCELNLSVHTVSSYSVDISQWLQFAAANALGCPKGSRPDDVDHAAVTVADLMALAEKGDGSVSTIPEAETCTCTEKCEAGEVNTACPVCSVNMTECAGKEPEPERRRTRQRLTPSLTRSRRKRAASMGCWLWCWRWPWC